MRGHLRDGGVKGDERWAVESERYSEWKMVELGTAFGVAARRGSAENNCGHMCEMTRMIDASSRRSCPLHTRHIPHCSHTPQPQVNQGLRMLQAPSRPEASARLLRAVQLESNVRTAQANQHLQHLQGHKHTHTDRV